MAVDSSISVTELYQQRLADKGYKADEAQLTGIAALQRCQDEWRSYKGQRSNALTKMLRYPALPKGVYLYGGVGRGKSFIMDCFFDALPLERKTRLHFHEFMREVHRELRALQGTVNPLDVLGANIAKRYKLICFDEFHVADITERLRDLGVYEVAVSDTIGVTVSVRTTSNVFASSHSIAMLNCDGSNSAAAANCSVSSTVPAGRAPKAMRTLISRGCRLSMSAEVSTLNGLSMKCSVRSGSGRLPRSPQRGDGTGIVPAGEDRGTGDEHIRARDTLAARGLYVNDGALDDGARVLQRR